MNILRDGPTSFPGFLFFPPPENEVAMERFQVSPDCEFCSIAFSGVHDNRVQNRYSIVKSLFISNVAVFLGETLCAAFDALKSEV